MDFINSFLFLFQYNVKFLIPLAILFIVDFICGFTKGVVIEGVSSSKLKRSVTKLIGYIGLTLMTLTFDSIIILSFDKELFLITSATLLFMCTIEGKSIIENLRELGVDIPEFIVNIIDTLKNKITPPEQRGAGVSFSTWINSRLGKKIDYDGSYGVQCVDLIDDYIYNCLGLKIGFYGNARNWWTERNSSAFLKKNFDFITPKFKTGELRRGDIGIRTSGKYGHIFIIAEENTGEYMTYYDENHCGNNEGVKKYVMQYKPDNITGVLRPKNQTNIAVKQYGDATMKSAQSVYCDSDLKNKIGSVNKGERVYYLGTGENNPIIVYRINGGYKSGFIKSGTITRD